MSKKVLFVTYENPFTKNSGDSIYTCNILEGLISLEFELDIIYYDSNEKEKLINSIDAEKFNKTEVVEFRQKHPIHFIFSHYPGMVVNRISKQFNGQLSDMIKNQKYDFIFVNHQKMLFTLSVLLDAKPFSKLIYISHNVEYLLSFNLAKYNKSIWKKALYWQDSIKTKWYERKHLAHFDAVTAISEHDAQYFEEAYGIEKVGIFRPVVKPKSKVLDMSKKKFNKLIIGGSFDWPPKKENLLMFLNASNFKDLDANGIQLVIAGKADPKFVNWVNNKYQGVFMTGAVPSLEPYYEECGIAIVPERLGGGFKLKVVEAAISKTAIFAISGAITKSNFLRDKHFVEKPDFEELISEIIKVQKSPEDFSDKIESAYQIAINEYTLGALKEQIKKLLQFN
ncbi:glycosyltransferase [Pararhodonellum marinum]|uniref:glycosyltransferase n=1 Tax=Pararhodonellum marinum TaxID=2755358 RepID=UPI00188FD66D|nr:glycosyltransferase [Pararhodonellum marinum]